MEINGTIKLIGKTEEVGTNGFTKRLLVVTTNEQYPQHIPVDFVKDKTSLLDNYNLGDAVVVGINLRGSEYNGKYYLNAQGWKINKGVNDVKVTEAEIMQIEVHEDDLPF